MFEQSLEQRAGQYAKKRSLELDFITILGSGQDGKVWKSNAKTVVKVFERKNNYEAERNCYQRLRANNVVKIGIFDVPAFVNSDDDLIVVEMGFVSPPCILDFGKAHLDHPPDFPQETMDDWRAAGIENFGEKWPKVLSLLAALKHYGIHYLDAKPGNIMFPE